MTDREVMPRRALGSDAVRYLAIAIVGLIADFAIALTLRHAFLIPLPVATAIGFLVAVSINYVLLERFLFERTSLNWLRLTKTYISAQGALFIRILAAWGLGYIVYDTTYADAVILLLSAGISFVANFFIVRLLLR